MNDPKILIPMLRKTMPALLAQDIVGVQPMTGVGKSIFSSTEMREEFGFEGHNKKYWPHQHVVRGWSMVRPAERWCYQNFKSRNWNNVGKYFAFKRKEDYEWFLLRWS